MTIKMNARFVRHVLADRDMSARDLAARAGVGEATMYRLMAGAAFTSDTLGKIATALGCHPVDLIEAKGYNYPHLVAPTISNGR